MKDILIVEDGLHERERLVKLFSQAGYSVSAAENAAEAERLLGIEHFRLSVLDIGLSDKSGSYLFELMKRAQQVPFTIILTGNPSVHLKQRFLEEGAVAYIVKASRAAANDALLETVQSYLGMGEDVAIQGIPLTDFIRQYISEASRQLFLDSANSIPACSYCKSTEYVVSFSHKTQLPPLIEGRVICARCHREMDPEVG